MRNSFVCLLLALPIAGCGTGPFQVKPPLENTEVAQPAVVVEPVEEVAVEEVRPAVRPPQNARTVEEFDTTTVEERVEAAAPATGGRSLGTTIASLGDPTKAGFWLETPLVDAPAKGRVVFPGSGKSAQVDLIPIDAPEGAGSRISLAAMRLIEAPLTDLPTIEVYIEG